MVSCRALQGCTTSKVEFMLTLSKLMRQYPSTSFSTKFDLKTPIIKLKDNVLQERLVSRKSNCSSSHGDRIIHTWLFREFFIYGGRGRNRVLQTVMALWCRNSHSLVLDLKRVERKRRWICGSISLKCSTWEIWATDLIVGAWADWALRREVWSTVLNVNWPQLSIQVFHDADTGNKRIDWVSKHQMMQTKQM